MKYKLEIFPAFEAGNPSKTFEFETKEEMSAARNTCADILLFMQELEITYDFSNMFIEEEKIDGEWTEID
ncbi:MAG: hypothetical protein V3R67_08885 [Thermodesulfobacteriota bacterium]